jgi:eukaryotic-like serine/threonine-protein kinase
VLEPGQLVDGKYRVERLLGKGGMGAVFEGYHTLVDRRVAIKVLLPSTNSSGNAAARFEREVRATGRIGSDHILEVYDVGALPDGSRYMVSEFLDGETLADRLARGPLQPKLTAELTLQLLDGLGAAHDTGIVHRDLKPENLFLVRRKADRADFLKIIDFGISKFQLDDLSELSMTATGTVLGTPYYLSPEQARGQRDIDHRSDLYAVGVIIYESVTGKVPFNAENFNDLLFKIALESPRPLTAVVPQIDPGFSAIVERAMSRRREDRYQSAAEMAQALAQWLQRPASGEHVPSPLLSGELRADWKSAETLTASRQLVTDSNFGLDTVPTFRRASPARVALFAGAILAVAGGVAALIGTMDSTDAPVSPAVSVAVSVAPAVTSSPPRFVVTASDPPLVRAPEHERALRPDPPSDDLLGDAPTVPPETRSGALVRRAPAKPTRVRPAAKSPAREPSTPKSPSSEPTATTQRRRDFGY